MRGLGQTAQDYLSLISQYESGNANIVNYKYASNPQKYSAQGYYQITNTNWLSIAPRLGIDTTQYPTAMYAPQDVQAQVANYLLTQTPGGISNWANYNPKLNAALTAAGMQTSGPVTNGAPAASASNAPVVDMSGNAASTPTATVMDQLQAAASNAGVNVNLSDPTTEIIVASAVAIAAALALGVV